MVKHSTILNREKKKNSTKKEVLLENLVVTKDTNKQKTPPKAEN